MSRKRPRATVGPWAKEKLEALARYLSAYTKVLKNQQRWCKGTIFVDAFAGPGHARVRTKDKHSDDGDLFHSEKPADSESIEFLKGSPRVALDIGTPFTRYIFIENDAARVAQLEALKEEYGGTRNIEIVKGDANAELMLLLASGIDWNACRAVVFLDPFGMQVDWTTIEALAKTRGIEVIVNFPLGMAIQRVLLRSGDIPAGWRATLDRLFGSPDWHAQTYEEREDLFGASTHKLEDSGKRLLDWYRMRLAEIFGHASIARPIRNTKGNLLYYLIWAGPHRKGLEIANYILAVGERPRRRTRRSSEGAKAR